MKLVQYGLAAVVAAVLVGAAGNVEARMRHQGGAGHQHDGRRAKSQAYEAVLQATDWLGACGRFGWARA